MNNFDISILNQISSTLNLKRKTNNVFNFRCLYCGDSSKDKTKCRGYIFISRKNTIVVKCHNCSVAVSFEHFLSDHFPNIYSTYKLHKYQSKYDIISATEYTTPVNIIYKPDIFKEHKSISELHKNHHAKLYLKHRHIPEKYFDDIFLVPDFKEFTNTIIPNKFILNQFKDCRLTVPLILDGQLIGYQGRTINPDNSMRYISIMLDNTKPKVWGFDNINRALPVYVIEGIFDAMFVDNSIAMLGADLSIEFIEQYPDINFVFIFDNEPRNSQIVNRMRKVVELGYSIVVWNSSITSKDINEYVLSGGMVFDIIKNTYSGIRAKLELSKWSKV